MVKYPDAKVYIVLPSDPALWLWTDEHCNADEAPEVPEEDAIARPGQPFVRYLEEELMLGSKIGIDLKDPCAGVL